MMQVTLPELPYAFDALEPHYDAQTLEIHYSKHHQGYTNKFNAALEAAGVEDMDLEEFMMKLEEMPEVQRTALRNSGGGYYNHAFFWESMAPNPNNEERMPSGSIADSINSKFGSFEQFKKEFSEKAVKHFGSGWAWLVLNNEGELEIVDTHDQVCPVTLGYKPILTIDVWEHAYYLKFKNLRPEWIASFFNLINWEKVEERFNS